MPWEVRSRGDEWCVHKKGESSPVPGGCHASRAQAMKQMAALYAQDPAMAGAVENGSPFKIQIGPEREELMPGLIASMDAIVERLERSEGTLEAVVEAIGKLVDGVAKDREAFVQALTAAASQPAPPVPEPPVVNVTVPEPVVTVNVPEAVVNVSTPPAVVNVEMPATMRKRVTFERSIDGLRVTGATIEEGVE